MPLRCSPANFNIIDQVSSKYARKVEDMLHINWKKNNNNNKNTQRTLI